MAGGRALARTIGERLCELAEMADFTEYHVLHGCIDPPLVPPSPEISVPSSIARCPHCQAPITDSAARGCTAPHGAIVRPLERDNVERYMRAAENHALREARLQQLRDRLGGSSGGAS
jgi:hypothetical protein